MKLFFFFFSFLVLGCSTWHGRVRPSVLKNSEARYSLNDISGKFLAKREVRYKNNNSQLLTKFTLTSPSSQKELEQALAYSKIKNGRVLPWLSQYSTWLEGKRFSSQIKYIPEKNHYQVEKSSPEKKWQGKISKKIPAARYICFFSQLPNCIQANRLFAQFQKDADLEIDIIVIWDNYPFYAEQYLSLKEELFSHGNLRIDGLQGNMLRVALEVQGQVIFYTFNEKFEFQNIYWVAQGYTLERKVIRKNK